MRKRIPAIICLLTALCLMLGLTACGDKEPAKSSSQPEESTSSSMSEPERVEIDLGSSESSEESSEPSEPEESSLESSESSEEESSEPPKSLETVFAPKVFAFPTENDKKIMVEVAAPEDWYGYEGDISLFRNTKEFEEIKVMEVSYAVQLADASEIDQYLAEPGFEGSRTLEEKSYSGVGGSSVYYYKTEAFPMGGMHELEMWYPCMYYVLTPDNTFVCVVMYGLDADDAEEFELFDKIIETLSVRVE